MYFCRLLPVVLPPTAARNGTVPICDGVEVTEARRPGKRCQSLFEQPRHPSPLDSRSRHSRTPLRLCLGRSLNQVTRLTSQPHVFLGSAYQNHAVHAHRFRVASVGSFCHVGVAGLVWQAHLRHLVPRAWVTREAFGRDLLTQVEG